MDTVGATDLQITTVNEPMKEASHSTFFNLPLLFLPVNQGHSANIDTRKSAGKGTIAKQTVKEVLRVVVGVSDAFPPLKSAAAGLLEIFERYDVCHLTCFICCLLTLVC